MKEKGTTLADKLGQVLVDQIKKSVASTAANTGHSRQQEASRQNASDVEIPASWRDNRKGATFGARGAKPPIDARVGSGAIDKSISKGKSFPALSAEQHECARNLARRQAEKIANKRAGKVATLRAQGEQSVAARTIRFNEVFARLKQQIADSLVERLYHRCCQNEVARARREQGAPITSRPIIPQAQAVDGMERLRSISADMTRLRIRGASIHASLSETPAAVLDPTGNSFTRATLGFDFGTAFSKAVVSWGARRFAVDWWNGQVEIESAYWLPSIVSAHEDGRATLGERHQPGCSPLNGLKMKLLEQGEARSDGIEGAVLFLALASRLAIGSFRKLHAQAAASPIRWRLHLGLPADSWDSLLTDEFRSLAAAALRLACTPGDVTRQSVRNALANVSDEDKRRVAVFPEFACQIHSYLHSTQRQRDVHALVDVGGGTLDVAFFNVHEDEDSDVLPLLSAVVAPLGTHFLIGARAGKAGEHLEWHDRDAREPVHVIAKKIGEPESCVKDRQSAYLNQVTGKILEAFVAAKAKYPNARAFRNESPLELFLCGGGKENVLIREKVHSFALQAREGTLRAPFRVLDLPKPQDLEDFRGTAFDRLSVAYGLSFGASDIGGIIGRDSIRPYDDPDGDDGVEDRDASR